MLRPLFKLFIVLVLINVIANVTRLLARRFYPSSGDEQSDEIDLNAFMDGIALKSQAQQFRGGSARAILGGIDLDLSDVELDRLGASLDVQAMLGGVRLFVPPGARVKVVSRVTAGGVDDLTGEGEIAQNGPVLYVTATVFMGGIQVLYPPPQADMDEAVAVA